jgi:hypothetical protein
MSGFEPIAAQAVAAEVGTTALASEVVAANALAAANAAAYTPAIAGSLASIPAAAGLGALASAVPGMYGVGTATTGALSSGLPTLAEQLATTNPEILAQVQGALQPAMINQPVASGLSNVPLGGQLSSAELANVTGGIPTATGPGVQVAQLGPEVLPPEMIPKAPVAENVLSSADRAQLLSNSGYAGEAGNIAKEAMYGSGYGDTAGMVTPEKSPFAQLMDKSKYLTKAKEWFDKQDNEDLALYGAGAGLGLAALNKKKKPLAKESPYSGPLSQYSFDPATYRAQQLAQPDPYRARYAGGGTIEEMSNANAVGANTGYPMADIAPGAYATPYQQPISRNVLSDASDTGVNPMTGEMSFAFGGLSGVGFGSGFGKRKPVNPSQFAVPVARAPVARPIPYKARYAEGGISDLGGYSDGGRMLKGPGDGMSDNIPASIAGKQPARLANEEFVVPADVVSHLGNGSSEAGAKQLYKMMDRVRQARTGQKKQGKQIKAAKYMPA